MGGQRPTLQARCFVLYDTARIVTQVTGVPVFEDAGLSEIVENAAPLAFIQEDDHYYIKYPVD